MRIKGRKTRRLEFDVSHVFSTDQKWCDKDHLLFVTMMVLNERFVEDEIKANLVSWNHSSTHREAYSEIMAVYKFWKAYPAYVDRIDALLSFKDSYHLYDAREEQRRYIEDQMMHRLIKIRGSMWT